MRHIQQYQSGSDVQAALDDRRLEAPYIAQLGDQSLDYNTRKATFDGGGANVTTFRKTFDGGGAASVVTRGISGAIADDFYIEGKTQLLQ